MSLGILLALALSLIGILGLFLFALHIEPETGKWMAGAGHGDDRRAADLPKVRTRFAAAIGQPHGEPMAASIEALAGAFHASLERTPYACEALDSAR
jgi:hypothetical protein